MTHGRPISSTTCFRLLQAVGDLAARHFDAQAIHRVLERLAILATFDGVDLHADDLDAVLFQDARVANSDERFRPDCPPRFGSRASGFSCSTISVMAAKIQRLDVRHVGHSRDRS